MRKLFFIVLSLLWATQVQANEKVTLLLDWFVNPDHAPLLVAQQLGYFQEAGLDVELVAPADPNDPPKLVAAGKADLCLGYQPQLQMQVNQGLPLVRVGTLIDSPLNSLVVLKDSTIQSLKDMKGKKIGFSVGGFEDVLLGAMLEKNGLTLKDVTLVNVNFSLSPALISGQVDAVIGAFRNFELNQMDIEGKPGRAFFLEEEGVPVYDELIFVAHKTKRHNTNLLKILAATEKASLYIANRPDQALKLIIQNHKELDDELNRRAWAQTYHRFSKSPRALDQGRYADFAQFLKQRGLIEQAKAVNEYAVDLAAP